MSITYSECVFVVLGIQKVTHIRGFCGIEVAFWPLVPKFAGSHPAEAVGFFKGTLSFGGEVKPSVPCRSLTACKRSLNVPWK
jgi:hypothetical protein